MKLSFFCYARLLPGAARLPPDISKKYSAPSLGLVSGVLPGVAPAHFVFVTCLTVEYCFAQEAAGGIFIHYSIAVYLL